VTLTDFCGYTWTEPFQIFEPDTFIVFPRTEICVGDIGSPVRGGLSPYTYVFEPNILIEETNTVLRSTVLGSTLITVTDACGQVRNGAVDIVTCEVPNVFSPNGDGQNEFFEIQGIDAYPNSKLQVWNRWGVLVYESENYENFWSAEDQPDGVYYFLLQRSDGKIINGEITIVR
jgi:gliding motility-associated-like protein